MKEALIEGCINYLKFGYDFDGIDFPEMDEAVFKRILDEDESADDVVSAFISSHGLDVRYDASFDELGRYPGSRSLVNYFNIKDRTELKKIEIVTMCDIDNPFYGPTGAAAVYGPQKGANEAMVASLDAKMVCLAGLIKKELGYDLQALPGSGAAGGMGGGMKAFFSARLQMGIETVLEVTGFDSLASGADMIFTGEGKIDGQSLRGKVVIGVARKAKKLGIPVIAVVGDIADDIEAAYDEGVTGIFSINRVAVPYKEARLRAQSDLSLTMDNLLRFMKSMKL